MRKTKKNREPDPVTRESAEELARRIAELELVFPRAFALTGSIGRAQSAPSRESMSSCRGVFEFPTVRTRFRSDIPDEGCPTRQRR